MTTASRSTLFLTTETHKKLLNERYERRKMWKLMKIKMEKFGRKKIEETVIGIESYGNGKKQMV